MNQLDKKVLRQLNQHRDLLAALVTTLTCICLALVHAPWVVPLIVIVGGISYFFGVTAALTMMLLVMIGTMVALHSLQSTVVTVTLELLGLSCVTWLGFRHKAEALSERIQSDVHSDQVVPWHVVNDVRTSLAAIRFLLFPAHNERPTAELNQATEELSRLENLFTQMEKVGYKEAKPPQDKAR